MLVSCEYSRFVKRAQMKKELFEDLVTSIKDAGKIHRGEAKASRTFVFQPEDVRKSTLQNWEQGRRQPEGPAIALLVVASKAPVVVATALADTARRGL
jgi:putative transcriptional regulator